MNLRANNTQYIVKKSTSKDTTISVNEHVAGFGKGGFKLIKDAALLEDKNVEFKLLGPDTIIQVNGVTTTLVKVLQQQRESVPDCKVNYHKITWDPKNLQKLILSRLRLHSAPPTRPGRQAVPTLPPRRRARSGTTRSLSSSGCASGPAKG